MAWSIKKGTLYLVGVPIGNDEDITYRAVKTLQNVDVIAAEDTRKAKRLLDIWSISPSELISHGPHNEHASAKGILSLLEAGKSVALITDSGMPGVSDPGFLLTRVVVDAGMDIEVLPGVSAAVTAVVASSIPCERFSFQGFLPRKSGDRLKRLEEIKCHKETLVFYEAPHRVLEMMEAVMDVLGKNRPAALCRELTKIHQEILRQPLAEVYDALQNREKILGEICLVVAGAEDIVISDTELDHWIEKMLLEGKRSKEIRDELAERFNLHKKDVYERVLALKV